MQEDSFPRIRERLILQQTEAIRKKKRQSGKTWQKKDISWKNCQKNDIQMQRKHRETKNKASQRTDGNPPLSVIYCKKRKATGANDHEEYCKRPLVTG